MAAATVQELFDLTGQVALITGGAFDLSHDIDLAIWYAGRPVRQVHALSGT